MFERRKVDINPLNSITSIIILLLFLVGLYYLASGVFWLLAKLSPVLLIAALVIDHNVVINYGKWLINLVKRNPLMGIVAILLSAVAYPVTFAFLLGKALFKRKVNQMRQQFDPNYQPGQKGKKQTEFTDYEEVNDQPDERLELPDRRQEPNTRNDYDQYFD